jgi:hypothetical protein
MIFNALKRTAGNVENLKDILAMIGIRAPASIFRGFGVTAALTHEISQIRARHMRGVLL